MLSSKKIEYDNFRLKNIKNKKLKNIKNMLDI